VLPSWFSAASVVDIIPRLTDQDFGGSFETEFFAMDDSLNTIQVGDCIQAMNALPEGSVDLAFADPPFNIGYEYDVYDDSLESQQYVDWSKQWITAVSRVLKPDGTFWLAIGDEYAAELKLVSQKLGFHCRSWVIWYYTFGVNCAHKFTRSHAHLFYFVKDPANFTFRDEDLDNRVPSARELVYNDKRANPKGRLPDDTWIIRPADVVAELVSDDDGTWSPSQLQPPSDQKNTFTLRPQDVAQSFQKDEDTWYFPRVAGTFKERAGFHGCQMPEQLLGRIIKTCSNPGDVVIDPFSGSATTLAVAKKLGRRFLGFDISQDYAEYGQRRLAAIKVGDRLDGSPEPTKSAPVTGGKQLTSKQQKALKGIATGGKAEGKRVNRVEQDRLQKEERYDQIQLELTLHGVAEAYVAAHDGFSADRVVVDPELNQEFVDVCKRLSLVGDARTWNTLLFRLRKAGKLAQVPATRRTHFSWEDCDDFMFASEVAWQTLLNDSAAASLDEILCDPTLSAELDRRAEALAPGHTSLEYRWAALKLRKEAKFARGRAAVLRPPTAVAPASPLEDMVHDSLPNQPGLYILSDGTQQEFYVGETLNLNRQLRQVSDRSEQWTAFSDSVLVQTIPMDLTSAGRLAWKSCLISKKLEHCPRLNYFELRAI
jgi:DNA modification methylase